MAIPESYIVQHVGRRCEICQHGDKLNHVHYCRYGEDRITKLLMTRCEDLKDLLKVIGSTEVDAFGVCDKFE